MRDNKSRWTEDEENALLKGIFKHGAGKWKAINYDEELFETLKGRTEADLRDKNRNLLKAAAKTKGKLEAKQPDVQEKESESKVAYVQEEESESKVQDIETALEILRSSTVKCPFSVSILEKTRTDLLRSLEESDGIEWWDDDKDDMLLHLSLMGLSVKLIWAEMAKTYPDITEYMVQMRLDFHEDY